MKETLFLFHTTLGVIKARKALQAVGMCFRVAGISYELRGGCGLYIYVDCIAGKEDEWIISGHTESIYRLESEDWRCLATFLPSQACQETYFYFAFHYRSHI